MSGAHHALREFLASIRDDPIAKQALADTIAAGKFPTRGEHVEFTADGLEWMRKREEELRREAN